MIHNFVVLILGLILGEIGMILVLDVLVKIRQLVKSAKGEQKMNEMSKSIATVYLESLLSSYRASTVVEYDNSTYRMIWMSENDAKALEVAIKALGQEPQTFKWCTDCKEYDQEKHCCHRWSKVIRDTVEEMKQEQEPILDKIRAEISDWQTDIHDNEYDAETHDFVFERIYEIIDEYKAESEDKE